jgi:uncharacterized protein YecE (DUF72 family)
MKAVYIGTSGWHYNHWRGPFYPPKLPAARMLEYYLQFFDTVEINYSFYRLPLESALRSWAASTPANFCFAVKGSRFLTHMKKLKDPEAGVAVFFDRVRLLGRKLGPVVFQLPPRWGPDPERLDAFLKCLPRRRRYAFELREPSWHIPEILAILRRHNAAFCIYELAGVHSGFDITADFTYVRLHGPTARRYEGCYTRGQLERWAERIRKWTEHLRAVYVYFDNDQGGFAAQNARELRSLLT